VPTAYSAVVMPASDTIKARRRIRLNRFMPCTLTPAPDAHADGTIPVDGPGRCA
jgi:hypothetical protein